MDGQLWQILAKRDLEGSDPVSWSTLQEQWSLSSHDAISLIPLLVLMAAVAAVLVLVWSGLPARLWWGVWGPVGSFLNEARQWELPAMDKWLIMCIARRQKLPGTAALLTSREAFDHHTRAYLNRASSRLQPAIEARIQRIRDAAFLRECQNGVSFWAALQVDLGPEVKQRLTQLATGPSHEFFELVTCYCRAIESIEDAATTGGAGGTSGAIRNGQRPASGNRVGVDQISVELHEAHLINGSRKQARLVWLARPAASDDGVYRLTQLEVGQATIADQLLEILGWVPAQRFEVSRRRWVVGRCTVDADLIAQIGPMIAVGGPTESEVVSVLCDLSLDPAKSIRQTYAQLLNDRCTPHDANRKYFELNPASR